MSESIEVNGYSGGPSELDKAADSFITDLASEFKAEGLNEELARLESDTTPPDGAGNPPEGEAPKTPEQQTAPPDTSPEDRGIARLVEREVAVRAREQDISNREARVASLEARIRELESGHRGRADESLWETDPEEALKAEGKDPDVIVRQVIAKRLGKSEDPQVRQVIAESKRDRRIAELEAKLEHQNRVAQAQAFIAEVERGARSYVQTGIGEHAPTVAEIAKANPERVYREIMEEISKDAAVKARGSGGDVLTYADAAKRVEERWSDLRSLFPSAGQAQTPASTKPEATAGAKETPKPTPPTATKPPERPLAPWLQKSDVENEGIKAGMAEYLRLEKR